ncbi:MAG: SUMF1/EgtB/PvdO family nonheme iron enzyme [Actinomycetota bacterium]|nr:SUMF1/EgtB/PvdO family nonheme iron enzyme [Actinomycetota bacterium]
MLAPIAARVEILDRAGALGYVDAVRLRTLEVLDERGPSDLHELVLRHELQHTETMQQAMRLGGLDVAAPEDVEGTGLELVDVAGGAVEVGAGADGFAYDNERPRHACDVEPFRIGRTPVTNASWLTFAEGGGYVRREWRSDEGWAWKEEYDIERHEGAAAGAPDAPVCHVAWFEADAFARAHGMRLPSEVEWERVAASEQGLDGVGEVWEWTASEFGGYPGFVAYPYREYSEVFFDRGYRVLRGGSCATHPRVASRTFRNWDLPQRRQLFAGVRVAADA